MFPRFGYEDTDAFVRARVPYSTQIGYWALDLRGPMEARLELTPDSVKAFTGVGLSEAEIGAFRAYIRAHAHLADFEPSRGEP